ncbi:WcaI family glycosyltransferase [Granulicella pectinivorans]|uniref:WcaI family glycosyltransferase n=1 Tax=Granulicella pectinivorans TaxID=474950 RepID=UPI002481EFF1|nr:WcaI family glycosyltransferase [Granulicella pectinivorans]
MLVYGLNYSPELTGIGKYTGEMATWLASRGHDVRVVTAPPYYPAWRVWDEYRGQSFHVEGKNDPNVPTVYRTPLYVPEKPNGPKRVLHLFSFMLGSLPVMLRQVVWQPEVVWTVEPTFFGAPLALFIANVCSSASWLHVQDFEVDAAFELGLLPKDGPIHTFALWLEKVFTEAFTRVSSISRKMLERSVAKGVPVEKTCLFPNWVDVDAIHPQEASTPNSFRVELGLEGKTILLYSGNMGAKQGLELLAPLAETFENDDSVHFLFCGDGAFRPQLETLVAHRKNVTMLPLQPFARLNDLLNCADIHLMPQRGGAADLVMPSKLTGMLSSGKPIVATAELGTQVAHVVGGDPVAGIEACGLVVKAEDPATLYEAVGKLIAEPELRARLGAAARRYAVKHLGRDEVLGRFERDLLTLARRPLLQTRRASDVT